MLDITREADIRNEDNLKRSMEIARKANVSPVFSYTGKLRDLSLIIISDNMTGHCIMDLPCLLMA
jgi:hypothetical protein